MKQLLVLAALLIPSHLWGASHEMLRSPWSARAAVVTDTAYRCNPVVHSAANIAINGDAAKEAKASQGAAYRESSAALDAIVKQVMRGAQAYQSTGSLPAVRCAVRQMKMAAQDGAMIGQVTNIEVVKHETETLQALAIAYLKLQPSASITPSEQHAILTWMETVLQHGRNFYDHHSGCGRAAPYIHDALASSWWPDAEDGDAVAAAESSGAAEASTTSRSSHVPSRSESTSENLVYSHTRDIGNQPDDPPGTGAVSNECAKQTHEYLEIALSAAAIGIAEQNSPLYEWALGQYRDAIKRISDQGMLRYDTVRQYALKFNTASAAALVQLAELGEANGEDLYAYDKGRLHLLVKTVTRGLIDPTPFEDAVGHVKQQRKEPIHPVDIQWAAPYNARFPDPVIADELRKTGVSSPNGRM